MAAMTSPPLEGAGPLAPGRGEPLSAEDLALLDRVAARVVELRMDVPAMLTLESAAPMSMIAGQTLVFFEPFVAALLRLPDYRRFARLIERRDAVAALTDAIEARAQAAERARREARAQAKRPGTGR
jgi:hypothetical protein